MEEGESRYMARYVYKGKYGKYFFSGLDRIDDGEHGVTLAVVDQNAVKSKYGCMISWLHPKETPYGTHPAHIHKNTEYLIQIGTNVDDPFDLGAEVDLRLGKEMERYLINSPTVVYVPAGFIHSPWTPRNVRRPFIFMQVSQPRPDGTYGQEIPEGRPPQESQWGDYSFLSVDENAPFTDPAKGKYGKYVISGRSIADDGEHGITLVPPEGKEKIKGYPGVIMSWLPPKATPYRMHPPHIHTNAEFLIHLGTNPDDPFDLGAEIELCMGKELEKYVINRPTVVYIPPGFIHSPWIIKKVNRPFIFLQIPHGEAKGGTYYPQLLPEEEREIMKYYSHFNP